MANRGEGERGKGGEGVLKRTNWHCFGVDEFDGRIHSIVQGEAQIDARTGETSILKRSTKFHRTQNLEHN